jgi:hypothetical protein
MVRIRSCFLALAAGLLMGVGSGSTQTLKFYPDDPIQADPKPLPIGEIGKLDIYDLFDYLYQTARQEPKPLRPAMGVNTLGEVPDGAWFTNRHGRRRMTLEELKRGPGGGNAPQPPFVIVGAKTEGISPGFRMKDAKGRLYFVKTDPIANPELSTGADVIGSRIFYAIGYNTPENYIVRIRKSEWSIDKAAKIRVKDKITRRMGTKDLLDIMAKVPLLPDGSFRVTASLAIPGKGLGPFRYEGTRSDDPNDLVPHEDRRELRGLFVFCSWLNHTDAKAANSYDTLIEVDGISHIRHYLIDFGSAFGSDGDIPKDARFGNEYQIPAAGRALKSLFGLGLYSPAWERASYPKLRAVGRIESRVFDPERWKPNYPNPAFLRRRTDDEYWAAKIVLAFTDEDIRALVETGEYSDPRVVDCLVAVLAERRDKIGHTYFSKILPLDFFTVRNGELHFADLAVEHKFQPPREYRVSWSELDNQTGALTPLPGEKSFRLPARLSAYEREAYFAARIHVPADIQKTVTVYLRREGASAEVVGIERGW